jgi:predicted AlkP superfamily pyrophosphatase or phosphodiesterase
MDNSVVILVADGLTPETLDSAIHHGAVPELAALADAGGRHVITTVFPSVTGVAYVPMLTGLHPAEAGIPGLRWYDRSRRLSAVIGHSRSYVGTQIRSMNTDLPAHATTAFEHAGGHALGMASMVTRGLTRRNQLDRGVAYSARVIHAHLAGDVARWAALEADLAETLVERIRRERPRFVFAAFTAGDKAAHRAGAQSPAVLRSLQLVDRVARSIRFDAERDGRWNDMDLWVVSDHGHSPVDSHLDLAAEMRSLGIRVRSHPWTLPDRSEAAVMVSGNSMAHVYLGLDSRMRRNWPELGATWSPRIAALLSHAAIDLVATRTSPSIIDVRRRQQHAQIVLTARGISYRPLEGDPLCVGAFEDLCDEAAHERTADTQYPDSVVQLARLTLAERSGDLIISASPGCDLRRRYEPIDHVSSHGALHRAHMVVPLVVNRRLDDQPRRTTDLFQILVSRIVSVGR